MRVLNSRGSHRRTVATVGAQVPDVAPTVAMVASKPAGELKFNGTREGSKTAKLSPCSSARTVPRIVLRT